MKKYKLDRKDKIKVEDKTTYRIVALKDFSNVKKGDRGGYIESHKNLSHDGDCWVSGNACVYGESKVAHNIWIIRSIGKFYNKLKSCFK